MAAGANFYIVGRDPAGMPHPDKLVFPSIFNNLLVIEISLMERLAEICMNQLMGVKCWEWPLGYHSWRSFPSGEFICDATIRQSRGRLVSIFKIPLWTQGSCVRHHSEGNGIFWTKAKGGLWIHLWDQNEGFGKVIYQLNSNLNCANFRDGLEPPEGFMAPKAWQVLAAYYKGLQSA